jgi:hypothetical protein
MKTPSIVLIALAAVAWSATSARAQGDDNFSNPYSYSPPSSPFDQGELTTPDGGTIPTDPTPDGGFSAQEPNGSTDRFYNQGDGTGDLYNTPAPEGNTPCCNSPEPGNGDEP